ncbi:hypothetical protein RB195_020375 [Necator americanus]|uniref:SCP domain-containing protein n=1 Tax=Necator americanus TaxID=51031 RepID=A0ABR1CIJ0_NECAM
MVRVTPLLMIALILLGNNVPPTSQGIDWRKFFNRTLHSTATLQGTTVRSPAPTTAMKPSTKPPVTTHKPVSTASVAKPSTKATKKRKWTMPDWLRDHTSHKISPHTPIRTTKRAGTQKPHPISTRTTRRATTKKRHPPGAQTTVSVRKTSAKPRAATHKPSSSGSVKSTPTKATKKRKWTMPDWLRGHTTHKSSARTPARTTKRAGTQKPHPISTRTTVPVRKTSAKPRATTHKPSSSGSGRSTPTKATKKRKWTMPDWLRGHTTHKSSARTPARTTKRAGTQKPHPISTRTTVPVRKTSAKPRATTHKPSSSGSGRSTPTKATKKRKWTMPDWLRGHTTHKSSARTPARTTKRAGTQKPHPISARTTRRATTKKPHSQSTRTTVPVRKTSAKPRATTHKPSFSGSVKSTPTKTTKKRKWTMPDWLRGHTTHKSSARTPARTTKRAGTQKPHPISARTTRRATTKKRHPPGAQTTVSVRKTSAKPRATTHKPSFSGSGRSTPTKTTKKRKWTMPDWLRGHTTHKSSARTPARTTKRAGTQKPHPISTRTTVPVRKTSAKPRATTHKPSFSGSVKSTPTKATKKRKWTMPDWLRGHTTHKSSARTPARTTKRAGTQKPHPISTRTTVPVRKTSAKPRATTHKPSFSGSVKSTPTKTTKKRKWTMPDWLRGHTTHKSSARTPARTTKRAGTQKPHPISTRTTVPVRKTSAKPRATTHKPSSSGSVRSTPNKTTKKRKWTMPDWLRGHTTHKRSVKSTPTKTTKKRKWTMPDWLRGHTTHKSSARTPARTTKRAGTQKPHPISARTTRRATTKKRHPPGAQTTVSARKTSAKPRATTNKPSSGSVRSTPTKTTKNRRPTTKKPHTPGVLTTKRPTTGKPYPPGAQTTAPARKTSAKPKTEKPVTPKKVTKTRATTKAKTQKPPPPKPQTTKKAKTQKPAPPKPRTTRRPTTKKPHSQSTRTTVPVRKTSAKPRATTHKPSSSGSVRSTPTKTTKNKRPTTKKPHTPGALTTKRPTTGKPYPPGAQTTAPARKTSAKPRATTHKPSSGSLRSTPTKTTKNRRPTTKKPHTPGVLTTKRPTTGKPYPPGAQTTAPARKTSAKPKTEKPVTPKKVTKARVTTKAKTQKPPPPKPQTTKKAKTQKPAPPKPQPTKKAKTQKPAPPKPQPTKKAKTQKPAPPKPQPTKKAKTQKPAPPKPQPTKKAKTQKPAPPKPQPTKKAKTQKPAPPKPRPTKKVQPKPQPPPPPGPKKDSWPKPSCRNKRLTDNVRALFLEMHNNFRGSLAQGQKEKSHGWGIAPPASLMYKMKYNCDLESYSQQHASSCNTNPLPLHALNGYRENIYVLRTINTNPMEAARHTLQAWWKELAQFGMRSNMLFTADEYKRGTNHVLNWSKMAWWNNRSVGCAVHNCGKFYFIVCTYSEGGNKVNGHVYTVGATCSKCPKGQCDKQALCHW